MAVIAVLILLGVAQATLPCTDDPAPKLVMPQPGATGVTRHTALFVDRGPNIDVQMVAPDGREIPLEMYFGYGSGHCDTAKVMFVPRAKLAPDTTYAVRMHGGLAPDGPPPHDVVARFTTGSDTEVPAPPAVSVSGTWEDTFEGSPEVNVSITREGSAPIYSMVGDGHRWVAAHGGFGLRTDVRGLSCADVRVYDQTGSEIEAECLCREDYEPPPPKEIEVTAPEGVEVNVADVEACVEAWRKLPCGPLRPLAAVELVGDNRDGVVTAAAGIGDLGECIAEKAKGWTWPEGRHDVLFEWVEPTPLEPEPEPETKSGCGCQTGGGFAMLLLPLLGWRRR